MEIINMFDMVTAAQVTEMISLMCLVFLGYVMGNLVGWVQGSKSMQKIWSEAYEIKQE